MSDTLQRCARRGRVAGWLRTRPSLPLRYRGAPVIVLSCLFFAVMATLVRSLSRQVPATELALIRFLTGLGACGAIYLGLRRRPRVPRPIPWALRGILGGATVCLYFVAIAHLEVGPATVLNYSFPVYASVFGAIFLKERLHPGVVVGIGAALAGTGMVALSTGGGHLALGVGAVAGLCSAVLGGAAVTTVRWLRRDTDPLSILVSFCLFGALWSLPLALPRWHALTPGTWGLAMAVGLLAAGAQLLLTYGLKYVPVAQGGAATQLTPALSWVMGVAFLGETLAPWALAGAALCVLGVIYSVTRGTGPAPAADPATDP